jgi:hypothetical protein
MAAGVSPQVRDQPGARAGKRRHRDRRPEQAVANVDELRQLSDQRPRQLRGNGRRPAASGRDVPPVHSDLNGTRGDDHPPRHRNTLDPDRGLVYRKRRTEQLRRPVPQQLNRLPRPVPQQLNRLPRHPGSRPRHANRARRQPPRRIYADISSCERFAERGHGFRQVAKQRAEIPVRTRCGPPQVTGRNLTRHSSTEGVADRSRQQHHRVRHTYIDQLSARKSPVPRDPAGNGRRARKRAPDIQVYSGDISTKWTSDSAGTLMGGPPTRIGPGGRPTHPAAGRDGTGRQAAGSRQRAGGQRPGGGRRAAGGGRRAAGRRAGLAVVLAEEGAEAVQRPGVDHVAGGQPAALSRADPVRHVAQVRHRVRVAVDGELHARIPCRPDLV